MESRKTAISLAEPKFGLGITVMTRGIAGELTHDEIGAALSRHERGDWGKVPAQDWEANDEALKSQGRLLSSYDSDGGIRFWIITEWDRSVTTVLLPDEY